MKESLRYLQNARGILKRASREDNTYTDVKLVRESCATAYLSVLLAINEYLLHQGLTKKELPKNVDAYRRALHKYVAIHNGKLFREFDKLYDLLHIVGYYQGLLYDVTIVKDTFHLTQSFIEKLGK